MECQVLACLGQLRFLEHEMTFGHFLASTFEESKQSQGGK
jgi:hypothetical protein